MTFAILVDVVVVVWLLYRQIQVRRVRPRVNLRLAAVLAVIGLIELIDFAGNHHMSGRVLGVLILSMLVGAAALGAIRATTVKIWRVEGAVLRQGTWFTIALWLLSLALHFGADWWIDAWKGPSGLATASLLLYLGITYGVQNAVVHHRAEGLLAAVGPIDARSEPLTGRWWGGTWVSSPGNWGGTPGGPGGPTGGGGGSQSHPDAIEARATPVEPPPAPPGRPAGSDSGDPGANRPTDPGR
jgi:hypothetical protein